MQRKRYRNSIIIDDGKLNTEIANRANKANKMLRALNRTPML